MTISEALLEGLSTTVVGLSIVFAVLIILMIVLMLFEKIFYKPQKPAEVKKPEPAKQEAVKAAEAPAAGDNADDEELIAVLTAAVAASLNTSTYNLRIKSYRRVNNNAPAWNRAGLRDTIDSRLN